MWIVFVAGKTVYGQFATTKLATTESQIATGGDLTFSSCVACRVKLTVNEKKLLKSRTFLSVRIKRNQSDIAE